MSIFLLSWAILLVPKTVFADNATLETPIHGTEENINKADRLYGQVLDLYRLGKFSEAISFAESFVLYNSNVYGNESPAQCKPLSTLGDLYILEKDYEKAELVLLQAVKVCEKIDEDSRRPGTPIECICLGVSLNGLGLLYTYQGKFQEAELALSRALKILQKDENYGLYTIDRWMLRFEKAHYIGMNFQYTGFLKTRQEKYKEAEAILKQALRLMIGKTYSEHPSIADSYLYLGDLYRAQLQDSKAKSFYFAALNIYESGLGKEHPFTKNAIRQIDKLSQ